MLQLSKGLVTFQVTSACAVSIKNYRRKPWGLEHFAFTSDLWGGSARGGRPLAAQLSDPFSRNGLSLGNTLRKQTHS